MPSRQALTDCHTASSNIFFETFPSFQSPYITCEVTAVQILGLTSVEIGRRRIDGVIRELHIMDLTRVTIEGFPFWVQIWVKLIPR